MTVAKKKDGAWLFAQACTFAAGATSISALPTPLFDEVAFAGRSNVGKSSLINALTGQKSVARVSNTPGRTQQLNFFTLGNRATLVDMPGHGYAKVSKQRVKGWTRLAESYVKGRATLRRVFLLADSKVGLMESDRHLMGLMDKAGLSYQIILTKCDRLKAADLDSIEEKLKAELAKRPACHPDIVRTSARDGTGIAELRERIAELVMPA